MPPNKRKPGGRPRNIVRSEELSVSTTPVNARYLRQLILKGQKGKNLNEAAERVISDHIEHLLRAGELTPEKFEPGDIASPENSDES